MINKVSFLTFFSVLTTILGIAIVSGCAKDSTPIGNKSTQYIKDIKELTLKLAKLEESINKKEPNDRLNSSIQLHSNLIKYITLRVGSSDDRLRIYWSDNSSTNLPCKKEQSTWICG